MHSRRPPSLRHKGNRRQHQQKQKQESKDAENPATSSNSTTTTATTNSNSGRKKKKGRLCSPKTLLSLFVISFLALYARFILSSASILGKGLNEQRASASFRGAVGKKRAAAAPLKDAQQRAATKKQHKGGAPSKTSEKKGPAAEVSSAKQDAEQEEKEWKDLVKDQTTKD
jgi:hypothetical protein